MGKICQTSFEVPEDVGELVRLLNTTDADWRVTVVDQQGQVIGFLADDPLAQIRKPSAFVHVYASELRLFSGDTLDEARAFLQGVFIAAFQAIDLATVESRVCSAA